MSGYIGPQPVPQATQHREAFTATASQTYFATVGYTPQFVDVYLNGVKLAAADYTATNGSDIVLTTGAALDDILEYVAYTPFEVASQTFTGTTTTDVLTTTGAFTSLGIDDNAAATAVTISASGSVGIGTATTGSFQGFTYLDIAGKAPTQGGVVRSKTSDSSVVAQMFTTHSGGYYGTTTNHPVFFNTGNTERLRIDSSGHAIIPAGVTLGTATGVYSAANTLDDYEEGTYSATLTPATSGTVTANSNTLRYSKVGRLVTVTGYMSVGSVSSPLGVMKISLPFTCLTSDSGASVMVNNVNSAVLSDFWSIVIPATNYISIYMGNTTSVGSYAAQQFKAGTDMRISVTYTVA